VRLLPRDEKFFDLFTAVATFTVEAAGCSRSCSGSSTTGGARHDQISG
jgi:hypothetical protein